MTVSMEQHVALSLLLVSALVTVSAQEVIPCMTTRENCTGGGTGFSGLSVINNNYYCCTAGYSMRWYSSLCSCVKTHDVIPCDEDPMSCRFANSISSTGRHIQCCHAGFSMQSSSGSFNGHWFSSCSCTRYLGNRGGFVFISNGMVNGSDSWDPNFNATEFEQRMREHGQRMREHGQRMREQGQRMSRRMREQGQRMSQRMREQGRRMREQGQRMSQRMREQGQRMRVNLRRSLGNMFRYRWF